jgi:valyl-tRNA synthetase
MGSFGCYTAAKSSKVAIEWYEAKLQQTLVVDIEDNYRISDALMGITN